MSKPVKDMMTAGIREWCTDVTSACVVDISGLDAIRANRMRGALKKAGIRIHVTIVDEAPPPGVDTPDDLERVRLELLRRA